MKKENRGRSRRAIWASRLAANPALGALFTAASVRGEVVVTATTAAGAISGRVTVVGTNAVEVIESNGDIVISPYSKITSAA